MDLRTGAPERPIRKERTGDLPVGPMLTYCALYLFTSFFATISRHDCDSYVMPFDGGIRNV